MLCSSLFLAVKISGTNCGNWTNNDLLGRPYIDEGIQYFTASCLV